MAELGTTTTINLTIEKGADFYVPLQIQATYCTAIGVADITGMAFLMSIRDTDSVSSTYYQTVTPTITDAANRKIQCFITDTVNEALIVGNYNHDVWRVDANYEHPFAKGTYGVTANRRVP